jgi:hypothetical protein
MDLAEVGEAEPELGLLDQRADPGEVSGDSRN